MKSIAEYFRGLAADDRYFGAEPPQPDAEMLHQIAEREVKRRVEARVSEHGVVLRQATDDEMPATGLLTGAAAPSVDDETARQADEARLRAAEEEAERQAAEVERRAEEAAAARAAEEEAARLAAQAEAARAAEEDAARAEAARIEAEAEAARKAQEEQDRRAEAEAEAQRRRAEAEAEDAQRRAEAEAAAEPRRAAEEEEDAQAASVTDRIARIHAVADTGADDYSEDEHADDYFRDDEDDDIFEEAMLAEDADEILPIDMEDDADDDDAETAEADDDDDISALLGKVADEATDDSDDDEALADEATEDTAAETTDETTDEKPAEVAVDLSALAGDFAAAAPLEDDLAQDDLAEADEAQAEEAAAVVPAPTQTPATAPRRPIARVVRVRRPFAKDAAPAPQQIEAKAAELEAPYDPDEDDFTVPGESTLTAEDEAALIAELAEVERDARDAADDAGDDFNAARAALATDEEEDEDDNVAEDEAEAEQDEPDLSALDIEPEEAPEDRIHDDRKAQVAPFAEVDMGETDRAIDRILEKTNSQLATGESTRRRNAIQHLKAAVQAKRADRDEVDEALDSIDATPLKNDDYRDDLARVVRPRRPQADADRPKRRLAPLVLVSEQRVDQSDVMVEEPAQPSRPAAVAKPARPVRPVRPRRVGKSNLAMQDVPEEAQEDEGEEASDNMTSGFRAFAADLGVDGIEDTLEAATAFVTQEVGRPWATRPQIISLALAATPGIGREAALTSFAQLLRSGQILKVHRGQFVLSEDSLYYE
ncbi:MAG: hypothetical protein VX874_18565 [Pseudomonadota bacterium]|nr:hypothetical protein [Pseudomonadota bacterium]